MIRRRKKRHHARKRAHKAHRARRRRRHVRSNPTVPVLFANPRRRRRRRGKARRHLTVHRRRRRSRLARVRGPVYIRRRSNPGRVSLGRLSSLVRIGLAGGLGIVTARIGMFLYTKYLSSTVLGTETDPNSMRSLLNESLRLMAGAALTLGVERALARAGRPQDRLAFRIGGLAECGRQTVGLIVKRLSPSTDRSQYGLDGYGMSNGYALSGLEPIDSFQGLEDVSSFQGDDDLADEYAYDDNPYQVAAG